MPPWDLGQQIAKSIAVSPPKNQGTNELIQISVLKGLQKQMISRPSQRGLWIVFLPALCLKDSGAVSSTVAI